MAQSTSRGRSFVQAYVRKAIDGDLIKAWTRLRDEADKLTNLRTLWTRAYAEHCANVYDAELRAQLLDRAQDTSKHVRGLWETLGVAAKVQRAKIRATGRWFKDLPPRERDSFMLRVPATKEALYAVASYGGADAKAAMSKHAIGPESTTARLRAALGKATPQDEARNAAKSRSKSNGEVHASPALDHLYTVVIRCASREAANALIAYAKRSEHRYEFESLPAK